MKTQQTIIWIIVIVLVLLVAYMVYGWYSADDLDYTNSNIPMETFYGTNDNDLGTTSTTGVSATASVDVR